MGVAKDADGLTAKQRRFTLEYLVDLNATQAAVRAGYSPRTAESQGSRLLRNVKVAAFVAAHTKKAEEKLGLTIERLEEELALVAFFDPAGAYDEEGKLLHPHQMPPAVRRVLAGFEQEALLDTVVVGEGPKGGLQKERVQVGVLSKVKWLPKVEAIALGMKRLGALVDRSESKVVEEVKPAELTDEEWEALAHLRHGAGGKGDATR